MTCEWYARCTRPAAGNVSHPILGQVPTCAECATRHGLTFTGPEHGPALPDDHLSACECCARYFDPSDEGRICDVSSNAYCGECCSRGYEDCRHPQCDPLALDLS